MLLLMHRISDGHFLRVSVSSERFLKRYCKQVFFSIFKKTTKWKRDGKRSNSQKSSFVLHSRLFGCDSLFGGPSLFQGSDSDRQTRECSCVTTVLIMSPSLWCSCTSCCAEQRPSPAGVNLQLSSSKSVKSPAEAPSGAVATSSFCGSSSAARGAGSSASCAA